MCYVEIIEISKFCEANGYKSAEILHSVYLSFEN